MRLAGTTPNREERLKRKDTQGSMEHGNSENIDDQDARPSEIKRQQDFENFDVEDFLKRSSPLRTPRKRNLFTGEHLFLFITIDRSRGYPELQPTPVRTKIVSISCGKILCVPPLAG